MRLMMAALVATSAIAIVAAVFAIWPVVADAPWEDDGPVPVATDSTRAIRCEGALSFRDSVVVARREGLGGTARLQSQLDAAEREIDRYC